MSLTRAQSLSEARTRSCSQPAGATLPCGKSRSEPRELWTWPAKRSSRPGGLFVERTWVAKRSQMMATLVSRLLRLCQANQVFTYARAKKTRRLLRRHPHRLRQTPSPATRKSTPRSDAEATDGPRVGHVRWAVATSVFTHGALDTAPMGGPGWISVAAQPYLSSSYSIFHASRFFVGSPYPPEKVDGGSDDGLTGVIFAYLSTTSTYFSQFMKRHDARPRFFSFSQGFGIKTAWDGRFWRC